MINKNKELRRLRIFAAGIVIVMISSIYVAYKYPKSIPNHYREYYGVIEYGH